jgi:penicillin-binding protein 1A
MLVKPRMVLAAVVLLGLSGSAAMLYLDRKLPPVDSLREYNPGMITSVYADDGTLIAEFARQQQRVIPRDQIPELVKRVFVAAEDRRFFRNFGVDPRGILRAIYNNLRSDQPGGGASTITMQVARTFFLNREHTFNRKIKESILALKIEAVLSKDDILYLYINQVDFGRGCVGLGAASEYYFGKSVPDLTLGEAAMLAGILPAPSRYNPVNNFKLAQKRQRVVLDKMTRKDNDPRLLITKEEADQAYGQPILVHGEKGPTGEDAPYFTEEVRRILEERYGKDLPYEGGLKVFTTVSVKADQTAQKAVRKQVLGKTGLDRGLGFRLDAVKRLKPGEVEPFLVEQEEEDRQLWLKFKRREAEKTKSREPVGPAPDPAPLVKGQVYDGVVTSVGDSVGPVRVLVGRNLGVIDKNGYGWALKYLKKNKVGEVERKWAKKPSQVLGPGDVVRVEALSAAQNEASGEVIYSLELTQDPIVQAGLISMSTRTGHVKALVGGVDYSRSQFIRPIQAHRQPGSSMKPLVYAAALSDPQGRYNPATVLLDGPIVLTKGMKNPNCPGDPAIYKEYSPENYEGDFEGNMPLRSAVAKSRNTIAVKVGWDLCLSTVTDFAYTLGIETKLPVLPCMPLGCGTVSLAELSRAYNVFASGGHAIAPVYITRVYDREGRLLEVEQLKPESGDTAPAKAESKDQPPVKAAASLAEEDVEEAAAAPAPTYNHRYFGEKGKDPKEVGEPAWEEYLKGLRAKDHDWLETVEVPAQGHLVMGPPAAYLTTYVLEAVITDGTAAKAGARLKRPLAGKTGTTTNYRDAMFMGYSPELLTGVWVGPDDEAYSLGKGGTGAGAALPIWMDYMETMLADRPKDEFIEPEGIEWVSVCRGSGLRASPDCPDAYSAPFRKGFAPTQSCNCTPSPIDLPNNTYDPIGLDRMDSTESASRPDQ